MKREMLSHEIEKLGGVDAIPHENGVNDKKGRALLKITNWTIAYAIMVGIVLMFKSSIVYPDVLIEIMILMIFFPSMIIYGSAIAGTKLVVPPMMVTKDDYVIADIRDARKRAFDMVAGPMVGYGYAVLALIFYLLETSFN